MSNKKAYQKELDIFEKLNEREYDLFGDESMSGHDKWAAAVEYVTSCTKTIPDYVNAITKREEGIMALRYCPVPNNDPEYMTRQQTQLYQNATQAFKNMKNGLNDLNRLSEKLGLQPFADIDLENAQEVGQFASEYVNDIFLDGHSKIVRSYENKTIIKENMLLRTSDISDLAISDDNPHKNPDEVVNMPSSPYGI